MDTRLKSKLKSYITNIWMFELVLIFIFGIAIVADIRAGEKGIIKSNILTSYYIKTEPQLVFQDKFKERIPEVYYYLSDSVFKNKESYYMSSSDMGKLIYLQGYVYADNEIYFIIRNKNDGQIITNDLQYYNLIKDGKNDVPNIKNYISQKLGKNEMEVDYDNSTTFNPLISSNIENSSLFNQYEEYYYMDVNDYLDKFSYTVIYGYYLVIGLEVIFILKCIAVIIYNKGKCKVKGNFFKTILYIFGNGFKYSGSRLALILMVGITLVSIFTYLYFLAGATYDNNLLVKFFSRYPFKSLILILSLPIVCILFLVKKIVDVNCVNDNLNDINNGKISVELTREGSKEIQKLVNNIEKIRDGYEIAIQEKIKNEKEKTELITSVSHDLRTPLTSIINYVNILSDKTLTEDERVEYLKILDQKSKKLKVLIDDLFEMSKLNSGKIALCRQQIDIMALIHQVIGEYSYLYEHRKVDFVVESKTEEIYMMLDGKLMSRVIENIIINAIKYSMDNTRIYVEVDEKENSVVISVKNIANYEMNFNSNKVFERFVRGDSSRNSNIEGSGLGLAITKSIIELHDGNVQIKTEGDMFKIYIELPKKEENVH